MGSRCVALGVCSGHIMSCQGATCEPKISLKTTTVALTRELRFLSTLMLYYQLRGGALVKGRKKGR